MFFIGFNVGAADRHNVLQAKLLYRVGQIK